jgi:hypothetical protein
VKYGPKLPTRLREEPNYYLAKYTLASAFGIVSSVTEDENRTHPISGQQLAQVRRRAAMADIDVKVAQGQEEIRALAMRGECELTRSLWDLLATSNPSQAPRY